MPVIAMLAAAVVQFCWGMNYSASKFTMIELPPFLAIAVRFMLLTLLLLPFMRRYGWPGWRSMRDFAVLCVTTLVGYFSLLLVAMHHGLNVTSCILAVQLGVPFSCLLAAVLLKDRLGPWRSLGLFIAFIGILVVAGTPAVAEHWHGFLIAVIAAFGWSLGNLYLKRMKPMKVLPLLFWPGLLTVPVALALSAAFEPHSFALLAQAHLPTWGAIGYSAIGSSLVGYGLWNWLLTRYPVSQVVPFTLLQPVFGITGGVIFFHDALSWRLLAGGVFVLIGVAIIAVRRPKLVIAEEM